jgi:CBS domain-containing protein
MKSVKQILDAKSHKVLSVAPHVSVFDALQIMADKNVGALVVLDGDRLVGIFSERDYARKVTLVGKSSKDTQVRDIMTTRVLCATPERTVEQCLALMTDKRVRHLPVIDLPAVAQLAQLHEHRARVRLLGQVGETLAQLRDHARSCPGGRRC